MLLCSYSTNQGNRNLKYNNNGVLEYTLFHNDSQAFSLIPHHTTNDEYSTQEICFSQFQNRNKYQVQRFTTSL